MDSDGVSRRSVLGGVVAAMAGSGCLATGKSPKPRASDWLQPGYDAGETYFKSKGDPPIESVTESWSVKLDTVEYVSDTLLIADETIYHDLGVAVDLSTGEVEARTPCVYGLIGFARTETFRDGVLLTRTDHDAPEDTIQAYTPTLDPIPAGRCANGVRWTLGYPEDLEGSGNVRLSDGEIIVNRNPGRDNSGFVGVDPADGTINWRQAFDGGGELFADKKWFYLFPSDLRSELLTVERSTGQVQLRFGKPHTGNMNAVRNGIAYFTLYDETESENTYNDTYEPELVAFDVRSEEPKWELDVNERLGIEVITKDPDDEITKLAVGPDTVYATFDREILLAIDTADGAIRWSKQSDNYSEMTATEEAVYVNAGSEVYCFDVETGDAHWVYELDEMESSGRPIVADSRVLVETHKLAEWDSHEPADIFLLALEEA